MYVHKLATSLSMALILLAAMTAGAVEAGAMVATAGAGAVFAAGPVMAPSHGVTSPWGMDDAFHFGCGAAALMDTAAAGSPAPGCNGCPGEACCQAAGGREALARISRSDRCIETAGAGGWRAPYGGEVEMIE